MKSNLLPTCSSIIAIFGSSRFEPGSADYRQAYQLGYALAQAGYIIINGGGPGSMEATASGAADGGGIAIGAIVRGVDWQKPNTVMQQIIECDDVFIRIREMYNRSKAFIILNGGTGTLAELAIVWNLLSLETSPARPLILVGQGYGEIIAEIQKHMLITPAEKEVLHLARDTGEVIRLVRHYT